MTEKKYMTASNLGNKMAAINLEFYITKKSKVVDKLYKDKYIPQLKKEYREVEEELDTHFINKDLLKDKINKKLNEKIKIWGESQPEVTIADEIYQEAEHKVYKEILEMLK